MLAVIVSSSRCCGGRDSLDRIDQFGGRQNFMCVGRAIDVERGMIGFRRPGSRAVANERDVKAELHADARRGLKAGVGEQAHADDLLLAVALELVLEVGVRKAARSPMLRDDDVALLHLKVVVKGAAPRAFCKSLTLASAELIGRRILPVHVVARFPAVVRHVIDFDAGFAGRTHDGAQVVEKIDLLRHVLDPGPELAAFAQEIVVEIDAKKRRDLGVVGRRHNVFLRRKGTPEASKKIDNEYNLFWPVTIVCKTAVSSTADAGIPSRISIEFGKEKRLWVAHRTSRRRKTGRGSWSAPLASSASSAWTTSR